MNTTGRDGLSESSKHARMNESGESRKETTDRKMEVLSAKCKTRIGFWNVRTMYETGKLAQATAKMRRHSLHFLGISESRWTGSGRHKTNTGEAVQRGLEKCLIEWKPINSRLINVRFKGRHINNYLLVLRTNKRQ